MQCLVSAAIGSGSQSESPGRAFPLSALPTYARQSVAYELGRELTHGQGVWRCTGGHSRQLTPLLISPCSGVVGGSLLGVTESPDRAILYSGLPPPLTLLDVIIIFFFLITYRHACQMLLFVVVRDGSC